MDIIAAVNSNDHLYGSIVKKKRIESGHKKRQRQFVQRIQFSHTHFSKHILISKKDDLSTTVFLCLFFFQKKHLRSQGPGVRSPAYQVSTIGLFFGDPGTHPLPFVQVLRAPMMYFLVSAGSITSSISKNSPARIALPFW